MSYEITNVDSEKGDDISYIRWELSAILEIIDHFCL